MLIEVVCVFVFQQKTAYEVRISDWSSDVCSSDLPPYFEGMTMTPAPVGDIRDARPLAVLGDSITTDHISPAGSIKADGPAGKYLEEHQVNRADFNSYGARRGNQERKSTRLNSSH